MTGLAPWSAWLVGGCVLLILELALPGVFLMWLGLAAIGTGLLTLVAGFINRSLGQGAEVAAFAVLAALAIGVARRLGRPRAPVVNTPQSGLVGRRAVVVGFSGAEGRVRVGDADWSARAAKGLTCAPGDILRVVAVEGMVLVVDTPASR